LHRTRRGTRHRNGRSGMKLKAFLRGLFRLRSHVAAFHRHAKALKTNSPSRKELRSIVRAHFADPAHSSEGKRTSEVARVSVGGEQCYLRIYRGRSLAMAARNMWISRVLSASGIHAPVTRQACIAWTKRGFCLALLETEVKGEPADTPLPAAFAPDMGRAISAFHSVGPDELKRAGRIHLRMGVPAYRAMLGRGLRKAGLLSPERNAVAREALRWLEDRDFVGDVALSHGDLHLRNILRVGEDGIGLLDLDGACIRPLRHDLALAESILLEDSPDAVKAFEDSYFQAHPEQAAGWKRHRTRWLALYNLFMGIKFLEYPTRSGLRNREGLPERKRRQRAEKYLRRMERYLTEAR